MRVPLTCAVPCCGLLATATLVTGALPRLRVSGLLRLLAATLADTLPTTGACATTVRLSVRLPVAPLASVAVTVSVALAASVGVPLITPVEVLSVNPLGRLPPMA